MKADDRKGKPLTEVEIRNLKPADKSYKMGDGGGLYLEIFPNGSKLWRLKYSFGSREKRLALGAWHTVGVKAAREGREQAKELLSQGIWLISALILAYLSTSSRELWNATKSKQIRLLA